MLSLVKALNSAGSISPGSYQYADLASELPPSAPVFAAF
jgi:hypothetical protein